MKTSVAAYGSPLPLRQPVFRLICTCTTPGGGAGHFSSGCPAVAARIHCSHIGPAACPPVSYGPSISCVSNPTQPPASSEGVNPMNQASRCSLAVPVLSALGRPVAGKEGADKDGSD